MQTTRRKILAAAAAGLASAQAQASPIRYVRFRKGTTPAYGILEGETIREIRGDLFGDRKPAGAKHKLSEVKLLYPITPPKVLAVGLNYKSHLGARTPPASPEIFYKPITSLHHPGDTIVIPRDSK